MSVLNDFVADNYGNILRASIFYCSGFLCAREYHFSFEAQKTIRMDKIKNAFSPLFLDCFLVCIFVQFVQIVYRKDCIMCMKMRRR